MTGVEPDPEGVPEEMVDIDQWVCWRTECRECGRKINPGAGECEDCNADPAKVPINPNSGQKARTDKSETWAAFKAALSYYRENDEIDGIGFMFVTGGPFAGIDLDDCRDPQTGELKAWASEIVANTDSYTEISPSGTGIHIILFGELPGGRRRNGKVEMYDGRRFFTVTGDSINGYEKPPQERQEEVEAVYAEHVATDDDTGTHTTRNEPSPLPETTPKDVPPVGWTAFNDDDEMIAKVRDAENGPKFERLFDRGSWEGSYQSPSEADSALCWLLSFYTRDPKQIDRVFRNSALMRAKWDDVHYSDGSTYGERTVEKAIKKNPDVYQNFPVPDEIIPDTEPQAAADGGRNKTSVPTLKGAYRALVANGGDGSTSDVANSPLFDRDSDRHARNALDDLQRAGAVKWQRKGNRGTWTITAGSKAG